MSTPFFPSLRSSLAALGRGLRSAPSTRTPEIQLFLESLLPAGFFAPEESGPNSRKRLFTLERTFWLFVFRALSPQSALREACHHLRSLMQLSGPGDDSVTTGALSKARGRFPATLLHQALHHTMKAACARAPRLELLCGRNIRIVDGTTVQLDDTRRNQKRFPQPSTQSKGCGFPVMKVLALFCLRSGAAMNFVTARMTRHDAPLARRLWRHLDPGDILLGDRAFGDYVSLALLPLRGVDVVARLHQMRSPDFRRPFKRLGPGDALFVWRKPAQRPKGMGKARWSRIPAEATVRVLRSRIERRGYRTRFVSIVTTLLDPGKYPASEIAAVYMRRWRIELSFRDIKTTMKMEHLRVQSPEIAIKELMAGLIAYNMVRMTMTEAARRHGAPLGRLSFKGTIDAVRQYGPRMARARSSTALQRLRRGLYMSVAADRVPSRPGRREPRAVKRRPKPFPRLTASRREYREILHRNRWKAQDSAGARSMSTS